MKTLWLLLFGALGGVLAGMGMGGGTLTIPLLVLGLGVGQLTAQFINLLAFLPAGSAALFLHAKNGLLEKRAAGAILTTALVFTVLSAYFALGRSGELLKKLFGGFLVAVAGISFVVDSLKKS